MMGTPAHICRPVRAAFTLIETVTALVISSVLLLAMASTIVVASHAVPTGNESLVIEGEIERGLAIMASDIEVATAITGSTTLVLTVPDRNGDATDETIVYDWYSGDKMLTRARNGGTPEVLFGPITFGYTITTKGSDDNMERLIVVLVVDDHSPATRVINVRTLNRP